MNQEKKCLHCNDMIRGRSDKKFCGDSCRNSYNNRINNKVNTAIRGVNSILKSNRKILEGFIGTKGQHTKISRQVLISRGFRLNFHTHLMTGRNGSQYFFSYEFGILLQGDEVMVVKREVKNL